MWTDNKHDKYRILLENLPDAFAYHQIITDKQGKPVDYLYLDVNPGFEKMTGLKKEEIIGKTEKEILPEFDHEDHDWIGTYGDVALTGTTVNFQKYFGPLKRWFDVCAYSDTTGFFVSIFRDITAVKEQETSIKEREARSRALLDAIPDLMFLIDQNGIFVDCRANDQDLLLFPEEHFLNKRLHEVLSPELAILTENKLNSALSEGKTQVYEYQVELKGEIKTFESRLVPCGEDKALSIVRDISLRKNAEENLIKAENRYRFQLQFEKLVSDISTHFVRLPAREIDLGINYALEKTGNFFQVDRSYVMMFTEDGRHLNLTHEWYLDGLWPEAPNFVNYSLADRPWWEEQIKKKQMVYIADADELPPEAEAEKKELKAQRTRSLLCVPIIQGQSLIGVLGFDAIKKKIRWSEDHIALLNIIAELFSNAFSRKETYQHILYLSYYDQLTGLYNRTYLEEEMKRLNTERQLPLSVVMADLNGLKLLNDSYGHATGDEMLTKAAAIFKESCRHEDIIARWGGDEFVILLPHTSRKKAELLCKRILNRCNQARIKELPLSVSLGVSSRNDVKEEMTELLAEAENAMYKQKLTESRSARSAVLEALLKTLEGKSFETKEHVSGMQKIARQVGMVKGLSDSELSRLDLVITLHDIGKINISEEVLSKKDPLNEEEWQMIRQHPETGYRIARATEEFAHVAEEILSHHERFDGTGYPRGLKKDEIPLLSRITAVVDAYDVMGSKRTYKKVMPLDEIKAELKRCSGKQFDPELVTILLGLLDK